MDIQALLFLVIYYVEDLGTFGKLLLALMSPIMAHKLKLKLALVATMLGLCELDEPKKFQAEKMEASEEKWKLKDERNRLREEDKNEKIRLEEKKAEQRRIEDRERKRDEEEKT